MSVGKTDNDGNVSIFTREGATVYKEEDVLITCQRQPIIISKPLTQSRGQWQPRKLTRNYNKYLQQANRIYDFPSIEEAIKWMHAVCGYPGKSTWINAIKTGNYIGWPMLNEWNVAKYYPETTETPKGHLNQSRKNVRSTKPKRTPLEVPNTSTLRGRKVHNVYTSLYEARNTVFSDQTGQFPPHSQWGNKYIMVMVEINSNAIVVEPIKSRKDAELTRAYQTMILRFWRAGIIPKKHILDNEVSEALKTIIQDEYRIQIELVPPRTRRRNAAEVAIRNFKSHYLSFLALTSQDFPPSLWDRLLTQAEIKIKLLQQSNTTPNVSAYAHLRGPCDYNKMPLALMGMSVQVHEKKDKRGT